MKTELKILEGMMREDRDNDALYWRMMNRIAYLRMEIKKAEY